MKIAIVYDHLNRVGGAERILWELHGLFPTAPFFSTVFHPQLTPWAKGLKVTTSFMQKIPFAKKHHEFFPGVSYLAFELFDFSEFDVVISVTSGPAKAIITSPKTLHICYCLTPTRYIWSHYLDYFPNHIFRKFTLPAVSLLRLWDFYASVRPDVYLSISKTVKDRVKKYYRRESELLYPPVNTDKFVPSKINTKEGFYLIVSRLVAYKHLEIAINASNKMGFVLKIIGTGKMMDSLRKLSGSQIKFLGHLTEDELIVYYQRCKALIFPQEEDFGLSAVEALACGRPVIGYKNGGANEIIKPGINGELFWPQNVDALIASIHKFELRQYNRDSCRREALKYSNKEFAKKFNSILRKEWDRFSRS